MLEIGSDRHVRRGDAQRDFAATAVSPAMAAPQMLVKTACCLASSLTGFLAALGSVSAPTAAPFIICANRTISLSCMHYAQ